MILLGLDNNALLLKIRMNKTTPCRFGQVQSLKDTNPCTGLKLHKELAQIEETKINS
jgi:hypothetical protein